MNLSLIAKVLIICLGLLEAVSSTPELHRASDGQDYLIESGQTSNWHNAEHQCRRRGYQLGQIDSAEKQKVIMELFKNLTNPPGHVWIASNDAYSADHNRSYFWSDTGKQLNFTNWVKNSSRGKSDKHCVYLRSKKCFRKWDVDFCTKKKGYFCETNQFEKTYNNDVKHKCDVVKNITSSISDELDETHKQQLSEINSKIQNLEHLLSDRRKQIEQLEITIHTTIQKILDEQQKTVDQLTDQMLQQANELNVEIKMSLADNTAQLVENLSGNQDEINKIC